jgi:hypothetical protein
MHLATTRHFFAFIVEGHLATIKHFLTCFVKERLVDAKCPSVYIVEKCLAATRRFSMSIIEDSW